MDVVQVELRTAELEANVTTTQSLNDDLRGQVDELEANRGNFVAEVVHGVQDVSSRRVGTVEDTISTLGGGRGEARKSNQQSA